jgi:hypothetical protein
MKPETGFAERPQTPPGWMLTTRRVAQCAVLLTIGEDEFMVDCLSPYDAPRLLMAVHHSKTVPVNVKLVSEAVHVVTVGGNP